VIPTAFRHCPRDGTLLVPTRIDGRDRPACPVCGFADFRHVQIGSNALIEREGRVLLLRLNYGPRTGRWALPGGLVEKEESGFDVALDGLLATWLRPGYPILVVTYRAHITGGELRIAPDEASEGAFFPLSQLPPPDDIAWPSTIHGLDAWRAFEPARP